MRTTGARRRCQGCGAILAADNKTLLCGPCTRDQRDGFRTAPAQLPDGFFDTDEFRMACESEDIGRVFKAYRHHPHFLTEYGKPINQTLLARWLGVSQGLVSKLESGKVEGHTPTLRAYAKALHLPQHVLWFKLDPGQEWVIVPRESVHSGGLTAVPADDEIAAVELSRRVASSDVGDATLTRLEEVFDFLATAYPVTPPGTLLPKVREHVGYVTTLMDKRKTLAEHKRLVTLGGWLSLLAATVNIDLHRYKAAAANLRTASSLARDVENDEIRAWCFETEAWRALTAGDHRRAVDLSRAAQDLAPAGSSALIQATAQEGRALARAGKAKETYEVVNRVHTLVSSLAHPDQPEHHYRYDPGKSTAYTATTLAWVGDPAAEGFAREVIRRLAPGEDAGKWPRRVATAKLDLSLALIAAGQLDEASATARQAILSGRILPSNRWRAAEIVAAIETRETADATELRDALNTVCPPPTGPRS